MKAITKNTIAEIDPNFVDGEIILFDKALLKSAFDCVYRVRETIGVKKVGHAGTLDPMATGLMIVCTGKMTKRISEIQNLKKTYKGIITLGRTTRSFDTETDFDTKNNFDGITDDQIYQVRDKFTGKIFQTPPMYSAVKRNGKSLYRLARRGIEVERELREVFISKFEIEKIDLPDIYFEITCSKGTYIRVLASDFGEQLGCGAYLKELRRTHIGEFDVDDALSIEEFKEYAKNYFIAEPEIA
ncbi:MAG: tRNA pseudouridine(55) synthase TruB [Ignavibacteriales bacterium]|nr:MAG: tRNA pseudouridine(55) synthase TruB [Ignavibacteriales bacterium]